MEQFAGFDAIKQKVSASNANAARNRNLYPIQEQATLKEIWEFVLCGCQAGCTCRQYGCTHHWKLKAGLEFSDVLPAFVRMFTDKMYHRRLMEWFSSDKRLPDQVPRRIEGAFKVLDNMRRRWEVLNTKASNHQTTLLCDRWSDDFWRQEWTFDVRSASVYQSKQFCILLPDIGTPFDNASRNQILAFLNGNVISYFDLLSKTRLAVTGVLDSENQLVTGFRRLDAPQEQLPFDRRAIALDKAGFGYGTTYTPTERPLSRIIDKYFYRPGKEENETYQAQQPPIHCDTQTLFPLSGDGKPIECKIHAGGRHVTWGTARFELSDEITEDILDNFFSDPEKWYPLGASMTNPTEGGLGEFISSKYSNLSPRHASAIARIMVQDNLVESRGKRPIKLKKTPAEL